MNTRVPTQIQELLEEYLGTLQHALPGFVTGFYLHGSIALDAFNEALSDIDFVAFASRRATEDDIESLRKIHDAIKVMHPTWALEGSYLQWDELGKLEKDILPSPIYHDGILDGAGKFDVNSVTWWVLKHHGIALVGSEPSELNLEVDWDLLITRMKRNLNSYWVTYVRKPDRIAWLFTDYGVQWTVLGVLRQYYSFVAQKITSKTGAGEYALLHLPARWHRIIREAIRIRAQSKHSLYTFKIVRAVEAYNFLRYIFRISNALPA